MLLESSDGDNLIKSFQDTLCEKYGVNDRDIYEWKVEKVIVPKGGRVRGIRKRRGLGFEPDLYDVIDHALISRVEFYIIVIK